MIVQPSNGSHTVTDGLQSWPVSVWTDGNGVVHLKEGRHTFTMNADKLFVGDWIASTLEFHNDGTATSYVGPHPQTVNSGLGWS